MEKEQYLIKSFKQSITKKVLSADGKKIEKFQHEFTLSIRKDIKNPEFVEEKKVCRYYFSTVMKSNKS